jgi:predicted nuclease of predicted toxin-antitoxin system
MKFLADMGVSPRCAEWLRARGHDAVHLSEQNLHSPPDSEVLKKAHLEKRILLTMDLDFAKILSSLEADNLLLCVIFRLSDQRPQNIQVAIEKLYCQYLTNMRSRATPYYP